MILRHFDGWGKWAEDDRSKRKVTSLFLEFFPYLPVPCFLEKLLVVWWPWKSSTRETSVYLHECSLNMNGGV